MLYSSVLLSSLHITNSTSHNALLLSFIINWNRQSSVWEKTNQSCECFVSVLSTMFTKTFGVSMAVRWSHAWLFCFGVSCRTESGPSSSSGLLGTSLSPVFTEVFKRSAQKKKETEKDWNKWLYSFQTKKYWHWSKWTKNKKSIFYSVYMETQTPVCCIALLYKWNVLVAFF